MPTAKDTPKLFTKKPSNLVEKAGLIRKLLKILGLASIQHFYGRGHRNFRDAKKRNVQSRCCPSLSSRASGKVERICKTASCAKKKYARDDLLRKITDFYAKNGRIPLKREFNMHREYKSRFGSWNSAIRAAGFEPNPELFAHKFKVNDGHPCDSFRACS